MRLISTAQVPPPGPPAALPARSLPQGELVLNQDLGADAWPEMDQTASAPGDPWD